MEKDSRTVIPLNNVKYHISILYFHLDYNNIAKTKEMNGFQKTNGKRLVLVNRSLTSLNSILHITEFYPFLPS